MKIFGLLKGSGRNIEPDGSIVLKPPYSHLSVRPHAHFTACYPNQSLAGALSFDNINLIFDKFYKDKVIDDDYDASEDHGISPIGIARYYQKYHKSQSKTIASSRHDIVTIDEKPPDEHITFLESIRKT